MEERRRAQLLGNLPEGADQLDPSYSHVYIDDNAGAGLTDKVPTPTEVAHISIDPSATLALGGVFPPQDSRVLVHAKLVILALMQAGFYAPPDKMLIGDPITSLGFSINRADNRLRVPELKRAALLSSIATFRRGAHRGEPIVRKEAESLVGKLLNISQVAPDELKEGLATYYVPC